MLSNDELRSFLQLVKVGVARGGCGYMGRGVLTDSEEAVAGGCGQGWVWSGRQGRGVVRGLAHVDSVWELVLNNNSASSLC